MLPLLFVMCAPPVDPMPPGLVPPVAVAGAAVVLGVDVAALEKSKTLRSFDEGPLRELQASDPRFGRLRRQMSIEEYGNDRRVREAEEQARRTEDRLRLLLQPANRRGNRAGDPLMGVPPGSLSLVLPAERIHPVIREELAKRR